MKYLEVIEKVLASERKKIALLKAHKSTKDRYLKVADGVEALCKGSIITKFWFFRTTDTYNKLVRDLAIPKDLGPRDKKTKTQRDIEDFNKNLRAKMKKILKDYLIGDRAAVVLKVGQLDG